MVLPIITFFCLSVLFSQCHAFVTSMSRGVYQPNQTIIFDERTFNNPRLLYALCDSTNKCRLEHDREPFERPTDTCQINLQNDNHIDKIRLVAFGKDKAILISIENIEGEASFSLTGVRFSDCLTQEVRSSFDYDKNLDFIFQPIVVSYEDFYDVIFVNSKLCGNKYCKLTIDSGTNEIRRSIAWTPVDRDLFIVDVLPLGSTENGLLTVQFSGEISIFKDYEDRKILKQSQTTSNSTSTTLSYSANNNWIGICELINNILNCSQFNYSGVRTFESNFPIDTMFIQRTIYNLPEGGMLILLINYNTDKRSVLKLDVHGIQAGRLDLRIQCNNPHVPAAQFFEKGNKYCLSLACFDNESGYKSRLKVAARCFNLSDIRAVWS